MDKASLVTYSDLENCDSKFDLENFDSDFDLENFILT